MINSIKVAADFLQQLPRDMSPEGTDGYEGFVHPYVLQGGGERTSIRFIIRDFKTTALKNKEQLLERLARETAARHNAKVEIAIEEQYRNMRKMLDKHPHVME